MQVCTLTGQNDILSEMDSLLRFVHHFSASVRKVREKQKEEKMSTRKRGKGGKDFLSNGVAYPIYGILKGLNESNESLGTGKIQLYLRVCIIGPVDKNDFGKLQKQIEIANPDCQSLGELSSTPGTVYIAASDVIPNIGLKSYPNSKDAKGNPFFPRFSLPTDAYINTLYCQYMNSKYNVTTYKRKYAPHIKLSDLRTFLRRPASNRTTVFTDRKSTLHSCLDAQVVAKGLWTFWRDYPVSVPSLLPDKSHPSSSSSSSSSGRDKDLLDEINEEISCDDSHGVGSEEGSLQGPREESSSSWHHPPPPPSSPPQPAFFFREHVFPALEDEDYFSSTRALREEKERSIPIRNRVVQCLVPIGNREPFPFVGTLPKGILLEFQCVPIDGKDTRANYNFIRKHSTLESPDPEASLEKDQRERNRRVSPFGNLHYSTHRGNVHGVWTRKVRSAAVVELMTWDIQFSNLEYKLDPGVALLPNEREYQDPEPLDLSHLPDTSKADREAKERLQMMHALSYTKKRREKYRTNLCYRRMYVPCISVDDLMRSGLLPSAEKTLAKISNYILDIDAVQASEFLFPRLASYEVTRRKNAASYFHSGREESVNGKEKYLIQYGIPHGLSPGMKEYEDIKKDTEIMIAYYEKAPLVKKLIAKDIERERTLARAKDKHEEETDDLSLLLKGVEEQEKFGGTKGKEKEKLEYYDDFLSSEVSNSSSLSEDQSETSRDAFGPLLVSSEKRNRKTAKQFPVRRNFSVRRVDHLSTRTCDVGISRNGVPEPYICFESISKYYCTHVGKTAREIELPVETYRWIPIWLFPFVLRWCQGDPLYEAIRGGDDSISFYVDMIDASIVRAANIASDEKGGIPLETAKTCRSMLRVATEFFEYEEKQNVRRRMLDMKAAILDHKEAITEHEEELSSLNQMNGNTRDLMKRMILQMQSMQHEIADLSLQVKRSRGEEGSASLSTNGKKAWLFSEDGAREKNPRKGKRRRKVR